MIPLVVKIGGSLYDWPELGSQLRAWQIQHAPKETLLVPGGGRFAELIRQLDENHHFDNETSHWLALRSMTFAAGFVTELIADHGGALDYSQIASVLDCTESWHRGDQPILDAYEFCGRDDLTAGALPHSWDVTSDSVAARAAELLGAELVLLKSAEPPPGDVAAWSAARYVDRYFPTVAARANLTVRAVNLRAW